jgi:hypothetical protein
MKYDDSAFVPDPSENNKDGYHTEHTVQWYYPSHGEQRTDAAQIKELYGIPDLDIEGFRAEHEGAMCYPDMVVHERPSDYSCLTGGNKGTDGLFKGHRDSGKTTMALNLAVRLMEQTAELPDNDGVDPVADGNMNRVVWRGRQRGSGWLALRHWTTLYLPSDVHFEIQWIDADTDTDRLEKFDLEDIVREVVYYDGVYDLLARLSDRAPGTFNVVYPDPKFRDCEQITFETSKGEFNGKLDFVSTAEAEEDSPPTPLADWWAPFLVARTETSLLEEWTSWICDEAGDLFPEHASNKGNQNQWHMVSMLRATWATSRKRRLSPFMFIHRGKNLNHELLEEFKWRINMPDGTPNPQKSEASTHPRHFSGSIEFDTDWIGQLDRDEFEALCYDIEGRWTRFTWGDIDPVVYDDERWLKIRPTLAVPDPESKGRSPKKPAEAGGESAVGGGRADD